MLFRRTRSIVHLHKMIAKKLDTSLIGLDDVKHPCSLFSTVTPCTGLPRTLKKSERKPMVRSVNEIKRLARIRKKSWEGVREIELMPPANGLLVEKLVPVAHEVYSLRHELLACVSRLVKSIPIYGCRFCGEVHVGHPPHEIKTCDVPGRKEPHKHTWERGGLEHIMPVVESFHLYDRISRTVSHKERLQVDCLPAVIELCVQAGVDLPAYATKRRTYPVYLLASRFLDFERKLPKYDLLGDDINCCGFWVREKKPLEGIKSIDLQSDDLQGFAIRGMETLEKLCSGVSKLMQEYSVRTCRYCPEVHVGPRGHSLRNCQAHKHQMRDGKHAWQDATFDDLIPPVYVWHAQTPQVNGLLADRLKNYYGKLPAVVELFAQAGAQVGKNYADIMRVDVAVPGLDEEKWVV